MTRQPSTRVEGRRRRTTGSPRVGVDAEGLEVDDVAPALCELGLAARTTHEDNARMVTVSASEAGHALMRAAAARRAQVIADALRGLPLAPQQAILEATPHLADLEQLIRQGVHNHPSR